MPKEIQPNESIHPDDREFVTRRQSMLKGLQIAKSIGLGAAGGSVGFFAAKGAKIEVDVAADYPAQTENTKTVAKAEKILHEHFVLGNQSQDRVEWAQKLIAQRVSRTQDHGRRMEVFARSWWKIAKYSVIGGGATILMTRIAQDVVESKTKKELSRRELFRLKKWV